MSLFSLPPDLSPEQRLPALFLTRYFFFLGRRPISKSNAHYLNKRLAGLKALGAMLEERPPAALEGVLGQLRQLAAINFQRLYPAVHDELKRLMQSDLPADVVVSGRPPGAEFLAPVRRLLLILGPAIGVGDEIITFSIPSWLRAALPQVEVTVLSAYGGLWDRVAGVRRARSYGSYPEVVEAIRGRGSDGDFDLVLLVDFENAALFPAVCDQPGITRYVEVSMAARSIVAFDGRRRRLHCFERAGPYFENHYENLADLMSWLDIPVSLERRGSVVRDPQPEREPGELVILVSPFSSKHDPIEDYWTRLLAAIVPPERAAVTRFVFDTGPNAVTERFARRLARATEGRAPHGVRCRVALAPGRQILSLRDMFRQMETAHVVVCVDSYAAHAAPLFGCTTFVLAPDNVASWRVPEAQSYYFAAAAPLEDIAAGIRLVLEIGPGSVPGRLSAQGIEAQELIAAADRLAVALNDEASIGETCDIYDALRRPGSLPAGETGAWPRALEQLCADLDYRRLLPPLPPDNRRTEAGMAGDLRAHLRDKLARLRNTNFWKLLERAAGRAETPEAEPGIPDEGRREIAL